MSIQATVILILILIEFLIIVIFEWMRIVRRKEESREDNLLIQSLQQRVQTISSDIQKFYGKKTESLETHVSDLEDVRRAMMNVMEDLKKERDYSQQLHERLSLATRVGHIGVWEWSGESQEFALNDELRNYLGIDPMEEEIIPLVRLQKLLQGKLTQDFWDEFLATLSKGRSFTTIVEFGKSSETKTYFKVTGMPIESSPERMLGVAFDITEEIEIDRVKTEFVSLVSHQLRTPLTSISWFATLLKEEDLSDTQQDFLDEIEHANKRMIDLINALLNISRLELGTFAITPEDFQVPSLLDEILTEFECQIEDKKLQLNVSISDKLPDTFHGDPMLVGIIFQNVISNAIKYTTPKGSVDIKLNVKKRGAKVAGKTVPRESFILKVSDSGIGIPQSQQDDIFKKLFRADNVKKIDTNGTGLGLYFVRQILLQIDGDIWFSSRENNGTTFYVMIPTRPMKARGGAKTFEEMA